MERLALTLSVALGIISIATIVFYAGYNFRTLQALRKTAHELSNWKQGLFDLLDLRYIRKDLFEEKMDRIEVTLKEIRENMERRNHSRVRE